MTLKTSLIITGDASVARKEVADLNRSVAELAATTKGAGAPAQALGKAQADVGATARPAAAAVAQLGDAQGKSAKTARELTQAADAARTAQAAGATAAREAAAAQQAQGQAAQQASAGNRALTAANDQAAASTGAMTAQVAAIEGAQAGAATAATAHAAAAEGLQAAIGTMVAQIAGGATVFDAMAAHGGTFAAALADVAQASTGAKAGIDGIGSSGQDAGVDLGGLGDTVVDTAGKVEGMGGKLGSAAAILGGPWGAAIGIGINLLGGFAAGLIEGAQETDALAAKSLTLAEALSTQGRATDAARQAIEHYNQQADQARQRMVIEEQLTLRSATAWLAKAGAIRAETQARLNQRIAESSVPAQAIGGTVGGGGNFLGGLRVAGLQRELRDQDAAIGGVQQNRRELLIKEAKRVAAAAVDPLEAINQKFDRMAEKAELAAAKSTKAAKAFAGELTRIETARAKELSEARAADAPAIRAPRVSVPRIRSGPPAQDIAEKAAAEAQRELARDLEQVTARYLPAVAAAKEYADELARIDKLAKSYDGKNPASGLTAGQADAARAALKAANERRVAEINLTPEAKAAADAKKSIDGVVQSLAAELAARKTLDPVQQAMARHQDELAKLSDAERQAYQEKLTALYAQDEAYRAAEEATRAAADAQRYFRDMALDAFDAIALGGENAAKVIDRLARRIASAAIEAAVLGTGPLAALMKGGTAAATATAAASGAAGQATADLVGKSVGKSVGDRLDGLFGKGQSGRLLQNAGYGFAAASIIGGSSLAGGVGGALGGQVTSKLLASTLGSFAGPLGSIAGGLLGGVVGKLFAGVKSGSATIGGVQGQSVVTGSTGNAAYRKASEGLAGAVGDSVDAIVAKLGGTLGSYAVSIGRRGDKYVVDNSGRGSTKYGKANDGITAYNTAEEAQAAALANAIADGAVQGLSPKVAAAFRSTTNIDKALSEALKVQELELTMGGVTAIIDKAFRDFETTARERVRLARQYGFDLVEIEKRNGEDRAKLAAQLQEQQVGSLQKLIDEMQQGSLFEGSAIDKLNALNTAIGRAQADVTAGVEGAGDVLANLLGQKLATSKDAYGTTGAYAADRVATYDQARAAISTTNARIAAAQAAAIKSDPALAVTNQTLDEIADQNARVVAALERSNELLARLGTAGGSSFNLSRLNAY